MLLTCAYVPFLALSMPLFLRERLGARLAWQRAGLTALAPHLCTAIGLMVLSDGVFSIADLLGISVILSVPYAVFGAAGGLVAWRIFRLVR